ncbi:MAG: hypothetical protein ABI882_21120, partial [Acidobacteriota bacterium]
MTEKGLHSGMIVLSRAFATLVGAIVMCLSSLSYAQSVEKAETSQQSREPESELERAKAVVTKPKENKATKTETGGTWGPYSTTSSLELGYRFVDTDGSKDRYLSDVNVRDGFRVLESALDMRAQPGTGLLFDFLHADVNNAGGDQSQHFALRMEKATWYRFDSTVRRFNYYRSLGPNFALGLREYDLRQQVSDFNLKVFPQRAVKVYAGYGRSMAKGRYTPTYSFQRDIFQIDGDARWAANDYRAGLDASYRKWDFNVEGLYRNFRNDPRITSGADLGFAPADQGRITALERLTPQRSRSLVARASVRGTIADKVHIVLRGLHDDEYMKAAYYEVASGRDNNGVTLVANTISLPGDGAIITRPSSKLDLGVSYDISDHLTLNNTFSYTSFRIAGDTDILTTTVRQPATGGQTTSTSRVQATGYITALKSYTNSLDLGMNWGRKFSANLGWRAMQRDVGIASRYFTATSPVSASNPTITDEEESIGTHAFNGGARFRPTKKTSFMFDVEHGQSNNSFVRINPLDYTRFRVRAQVHATDKIGISGTFTSLDRTNPTPQVENDSNSRSYTVAVNWEPKPRIWVDAGYDYHDLSATGNILYTTVINNVTTRVSGKSLYYARLNSFYANVRLGLTNRLDLLMVYYYLMDRGAPAVIVGANDFV